MSAPNPNPNPEQQPQPAMSPADAHRQAQAAARAARAHAKALRPWYKKKRFVLPLALVALIVIGQVAGGSGDDGPVAGVPAGSASSQAPSAVEPSEAEVTEEVEAEKPTADTPKIGDSVTAGDWTFKVTKIKCGATKVGDDFLSRKAQGQYCILDIAVTNDGTESESLFADNQKLLDSKGREYSADSEASFYLGSDSSLLAEDINPGNTLKGQIAFDVPKKVKPVSATLAGGIFGVIDTATVDLR